MYLASEKGKRVLNFCYSWGASIVIIGALFKLLHLPYGNQILFVAMTVEALVFFISAFEKPFNEYHWEEVFPVLNRRTRSTVRISPTRLCPIWSIRLRIRPTTRLLAD